MDGRAPASTDGLAAVRQGPTRLGGTQQHPSGKQIGNESQNAKTGALRATSVKRANPYNRRSRQDAVIPDTRTQGRIELPKFSRSDDTASTDCNRSTILPLTVVSLIGNCSFPSLM